MHPERSEPQCRVCGSPTPRILSLGQSPVTVQNLLMADQVELDRAVPLTLGRCSRCVLVQQTEDPKLGRIYSSDYLHSVNFSAHAQDYQAKLARRWAEAFDLRGRRVLEVGGGDGFFADLLRKEGCDVTLVEPSPRACEIARGRGLPRVIQGYLTPETLPGESFEAVVARHVLEHVPRPVEFLRLLRDHLGAEGRLFVEVPNLDGIVRNGRFQDFYAEHILYFEPRSLAFAAVEAGFEVEEIATVEGGDYLTCVGRGRARGLDELLAEQGRFVAAVRAMAEESRSLGRRMAVWGAGGRCVSLMALIGARDLGLAYAVDSDRAKWGRFLPMTHLPVVSPETLRDDPVDDLLVAATAFQAEILDGLAWFRAPGRRVGLVQPEPRWVPFPEAEGP